MSHSVSSSSISSSVLSRSLFQTLVSSHWFCWESGGVVLHVVNNNKQCVLIRRRQTVVLISESALTLTHTEENLIRSGLKPVSGPSLSPGPGWRLKYIYFFIEHWLGGQDQVCCQKVAGSNPNFAVVFWGRTKNDFAGDKGPIKWWIFQLILFLITILLLWFGGSF